MTTQKEKFTIDVKNEGITIKGEKGQHLFFTPVEALMLLDILKAEEATLRNLADEASPVPFKITV